MISLCFILLSRTISSTFLEIDLPLSTRTATGSPEMGFFIVKNKSFYFRCPYSSNASSVTIIADFLIPLNNKDYYVLPY